MLKQHAWFKYADELHIELLQAEDEGKNISEYVERVHKIQKETLDESKKEQMAIELLDAIAGQQPDPGYKYVEPSDLAAIKALRSKSVSSAVLDNSKLTPEILSDKIYGAWLGRCAGCLLGQPIEGWQRERILGLLKDTDNYPVKYYISSAIPEELRLKYKVVDEGKVYGSRLINWINNIKYMPEDDDTNYTVLALKILEEYGPGFTPDDVAESWLSDLPILHVCTAERVAYKNLVNSIYPPLSASHRNMYREWIGAQIRTDFYGYITPGNPELGAEMAWRDASISHTKNGIYGAMFISAMLSAAPLVDNMNALIEYGLAEIPENSRLTEAVRMVLQWKKDGFGWEDAIEKIHRLYNEKSSHHWCHTISNAMIVTLGLIYGELDFEKSIGIAVSAAFDTDCNGATAGSILGMLLGAEKLPAKWILPLNDQLKSGVDGFGLMKISELAERTLKIARNISKL